VQFTVAQPRAGRRGKHGACVPRSIRNRKAPRCTRIVLLHGSFSLTGRAGTNTFRFTGRLAGHAIKPGHCLLIATPTANGDRGKPASAAFQIIAAANAAGLARTGASVPSFSWLTLSW
jgi:hypothetical protein